jgi:hypothetical protein
MDYFAILLADLSTLIDTQIYSDTKKICQLSIDSKLHIQLKEDAGKDRMLISAFIHDIPPGRFREHVLRDTLKENYLYPRTGTFAYCDRNNQLALFAYVYYQNLTAEGLADFLETFIERCFTWQTAIETGQLPARGQTYKKTGPSIFDIMKK